MFELTTQERIDELESIIARHEIEMAKLSIARFDLAEPVNQLLDRIRNYRRMDDLQAARYHAESFVEGIAFTLKRSLDEAIHVAWLRIELNDLMTAEN